MYPPIFLSGANIPFIQFLFHLTPPNQAVNVCNPINKHDVETMNSHNQKPLTATTLFTGMCLHQY